MAGIAAPKPLIVTGFTAATDLTGKQYCLLKYSAENTLTYAAANTDLAVGVLYNEPYTGEPVELVPLGQICMMKVDGNAGAIVPGTRLTSDAAGVGHATTTNLQRVSAIALDNSSADGDVIMVALIASDVSLT
jgi:hypothetical protein